jgi:NADP-dependent 3-hydroxy acid dehydrogenase YdfG
MPMRKVAVVTGAGSGIGKASALALMRNGFSVVLNGRRKEPLEAGLWREGPLARKPSRLPGM